MKIKKNTIERQYVAQKIADCLRMNSEPYYRGVAIGTMTLLMRSNQMSVSQYRRIAANLIVKRLNFAGQNRVTQNCPKFVLRGEKVKTKSLN